MSRGLLLRIVIVVAILGAAAYFGLRLLRPLVTVTEVRRGTAASAVPGTVTVRAERTYRVIPEVSGRLLEHELHVGQIVEEGQVLVQIDTALLEIEIEQIKADIAAINRRMEVGSTQVFNLETQQDRLKFMETLLEKNAIAPSEVDVQRRTIRGIEQAIQLEKNEWEQRRDTLEATLKSKETALGKMTLHSPIKGVISQVNAYGGDLVGGGTLVAEVISLTRIVDVKISEENFNFVKVGQGATVRLAGYPDKFSGKVSKLATTADALTQRYVVELTVDADPQRLVPGMTGEAVITVSERPNALLVPRPALVGNVLYVVNEGRVSVREVEIGFTALNEAEILSGVEENELVALDGHDFLREGTRVRTQAARRAN